MDKLTSKTGFDEIRRQIADRCRTQYARQRTEDEVFSSDSGEIRRRLTLTDEMRLVAMFEDGFPMDGFIDSIPFLKPLEKEGYCIDAASLGKLRTALDHTVRLCKFFSGTKDGVYPNLKAMSEDLALFPEINRKIGTIIDKFGEIRDNASEKLGEIRASLRSKEAAMSKRAAAALKEARDAGLAEAEASVIVREGKFLIPVITSSKRKVPGLVFGCSATGKTTFIAPAETVELENDIARLRYEEEVEISRILYEFSEFLRPYIPALISNAGITGEFDFLLAKAQTALDIIAGMPLISEDGSLSLRKARHPLLEKALSRDGKLMNPLTVTLTPQKRILLISGPNAGGKSVCLKTVGLLQYMMQWGMLIPTSESSELPVFDRIIISMGDDQSLENDLSTYSSFLADMRQMLSCADERTLVLIDEFGSGTEPASGGAIAEAILAELDRRGVWGVITTHYTNLKLYASEDGTNVINGSMMYDSERIEPLFSLEIGLPGNSFAFELARKMKLPESIVKDAEARAGSGYVGMERNLRRIADGRRALDEKIRRMKDTDKTLENLTEKYRKALDDIQQKRDDIIDEAHREAEDIVKSAGRQVEKTIRDIKEAGAEKERTKAARQELRGFADALGKKKSEEETNRRKRNAAAAEDHTPLAVGDKVRVKGNGMIGEIVKIAGTAATVTIGNISSKTRLDKLERISANEYRQKEKQVVRPAVQKSDEGIRERRLDFSPELDVRGERLADALDIVTHYIDDAIMVGVPSVRIIHGKGTGVLREELQKYLKTMGGISGVSDEDIRHGGTGVTIVKF